jgi:hypothetical protein
MQWELFDTAHAGGWAADPQTVPFVGCNIWYTDSTNGVSSSWQQGGLQATGKSTKAQVTMEALPGAMVPQQVCSSPGLPQA